MKFDRRVGHGNRRAGCMALRRQPLSGEMALLKPLKVDRHIDGYDWLAHLTNRQREAAPKICSPLAFRSPMPP
jgi:hypothetical protein